MIVLYHHSTERWTECILPQKIRPDRDCPALIYLYKDSDELFTVKGLLPQYTYRVRLPHYPVKLLYNSVSWAQALTAAKLQGTDLSKLWWTPKPIHTFELLWG